jgi:hypothetical protein
MCRGGLRTASDADSVAVPPTPPRFHGSISGSAGRWQEFGGVPVTGRTEADVDPLDREFAPGWAPEAGDKIRGKLIQRDERDGGFGAYPIYTLALADGYEARIGGGLDALDEVAVHASRDVLRRKLAPGSSSAMTSGSNTRGHRRARLGHIATG